MDLRRKLVVRLVAALLVFGVAFAATLIVSGRADARAEQSATARLLQLLLEPRTPETLERLHDAASRGQLRHLRAHWTDETLPGAAAPSAWERLLAPTHDGRGRHLLEAGGRALVLEADPRSELREQWRDAARVVLLLGGFGLLAIGLVWIAVDRALSPVAALEAALRAMPADRPGRRAPHFQLREFESVARVIDQVALSLEQARAERQRLTRALLEVQDRERRELAADLHDEVGQSLAAISVAAAFIRQHAARAEPAQLVDCATEIAAESRRIAGHVRDRLATLRPYAIAADGLADALAELVGGWQARLADVAIERGIAPLPAVTDALAITAYRCVQELMTNAVRHSGARRIRVDCRGEGGTIVIDVSDDGTGRPDDLRGGGIGLAGLRERLAMVGGELGVAAAPGGGLVFTVRIPVVAAAAPGADAGAR